MNEDIRNISWARVPALGGDRSRVLPLGARSLRALWDDEEPPRGGERTWCVGERARERCRRAGERDRGLRAGDRERERLWWRGGERERDLWWRGERERPMGALDWQV